MPMKALLASALGGLVLLAAVPAGAMDPAPLPAFEVKSLDGRSVASSALGSTGQWLLLYVTPRSRPSTLLMGLIKQDQADASGRIVVVVGGSLAEAKAACAATPGLARAGWYADPEHSAFDALAIDGAPTAMGLRERVMQWKMQGVLADGHTVKSILLTWLAE